MITVTKVGTNNNISQNDTKNDTKKLVELNFSPKKDEVIINVLLDFQ